MSSHVHPSQAKRSLIQEVISMRRGHLQNFNLSFKSSLVVHSLLPVAQEFTSIPPTEGAPGLVILPSTFLTANTTFSYII